MSDRVTVAVKFSFSRRDTEKAAEVLDCISKLCRAVMTPAELRQLAAQLNGKARKLHVKRQASPEPARITYPRVARPHA
jgi:hypothetical protein